MSEISHSKAVERLGDALGWDDWTRARTSGDLRDAVEEAEAEIARRGLLPEYAAAVLMLTDLPPSDGSGRALLLERGLLITAPPDVRVRAMLQVLEDQ